MYQDQDHYAVLGVDRDASQRQVERTFEKLLRERKAKRQKTADLYAAVSVLGNYTLRKAYDFNLLGAAAGEKVAQTKEVALQMCEFVPEIDLRELACEAKTVALKSVVVLTGMTSAAGEATVRLSRALQLAASRQLLRQPSVVSAIEESATSSASSSSSAR